MRQPIEGLSRRFKVRPLGRDDIPALYALCKGNPGYYGSMKTEPTPQGLAQQLTALPPGKDLAEKHFVCFFEEGRLIALLDLVERYPDAHTAFIGWFMVESALQGRGCGSAILAGVFAFLKREGVGSVKLGVIQGNRPAEEFWKKNGFAFTGEEAQTEAYAVRYMRRPL